MTTPSDFHTPEEAIAAIVRELVAHIDTVTQHFNAEDSRAVHEAIAQHCLEHPVAVEHIEQGPA